MARLFFRVLRASAAPYPNVRFMCARLSRIIALGFGCGLVPVAQGTVGTLFAWCAFHVISIWMGLFGWLVALFVCFSAGVIACERTGLDLSERDHPAMVCDEIVAFWVVLVGAAWLRLGAPEIYSFLLFRLFDIWKPFPVRYFDRMWKGGWGVMCDDLCAALYALLILKWLSS